MSSAAVTETGRPAASAAVLAAMAMVVLDAGMANVALPSLSRAFQVASSDAVWVVTAYQTALLMVLLPWGAVGERWGFRAPFAAGVALFTLASALSAAAPSFAWLLAGRFAQGLGGGAVMALGIALLRAATPPAQFGRAIGWNAMAVAGASAAGPGIGALVLATGGWSWIFVLNLPVGVAVLLAARALPSVAPRPGETDVASIALNALTFGGLVLGVATLARLPVAGAFCLAAAALAGAALVWREWPKAAPLAPLDLFRRRPFALAVLASVICFAAQTVGLICLPFHLQARFGLSPVAAGLVLTAWPVAVGIAAAFVGRMADRVSPAWLCMVGAMLMAAGLAGAAVWPPGRGGAVALLSSIVLCGAGFGFFQTPNNRLLFLSAPADRAGAAGGMQATARLTGQTAGALLAGGMLAAGATNAAFAVGAALAALAASISLARRH